MGRLSDALAARRFLVGDGAMGTSLFERGLQTGEAPELWNQTHPDKVQSVHQEFIEAGCDIILTNSFGGNYYRLQLHSAEHRVEELNRCAAELGVAVIEKCGRDILLGGSVGPSGEILQPVGTLSVEAAQAAFRQQAQGLVAGGVDVLWIETMSSLEEVGAAIAGCSGLGVDVVATMTFDTNGHTMMGVKPSQALAYFDDCGFDLAAYGLNCGLGPAETVASLLEMRQAVRHSDKTVLVCQSNCGIPHYSGGQFCFSGTPQLMRRYARLAYACGARIIGGCCGSGGEVMRAIRDSLDTMPSTDIALPGIDDIVADLGAIQESAYALHTSLAGASGERKRRRH